MTCAPNKWLLALAIALTAVGLLPIRAEAQQAKVLFVPAPSLPGPLRRAVPRVLVRGGRLVANGTYTAAARGRNLSPASGAAIRRFGTRQGARVIVVAGFGVSGRDKLLRMRYYHGRTGAEIHARTLRLRGVHIDGRAQSRILHDLENAVARGRRGGRRVARADEPSPGARRGRRRRAGRRTSAIRRFNQPPDDEEEESGGETADGLPPPVDWNEEAEAADEEEEPAPRRRRRRRRGAEPEDDEEEELVEEEEEELDDDEYDDEEGGGSAVAYMSRQWGFDVTAGVGFGQRTAAVPMETGEGRFSSSPFPAIHAALNIWLRPGEDSSLRIGLGSRYYTSVGLQAQDERPDGTTRTVDTRSQDLAIGANLNFALADSVRAVRMNIEAGWGFRMLDSELPLSMPTYTLSGPYGRIGLFFPIGDEGPLVLGVVPEVGHVSSVSEEVAQAGQVSDGFSVAIEAQVRLTLIPELDVDLVYREAHAFLSSEREGDMSDVARFGVVRVTYRP
jgi:hypothetical protein